MPMIKEYTLQALEKAIVHAETTRQKLTDAAFVQIDTRILAGLIESQRKLNAQGADLRLWLVTARDHDDEGTGLDLVLWAPSLDDALRVWRHWAAAFLDVEIEDFDKVPDHVFPLPMVPKAPYARALPWHHWDGLQDAIKEEPATTA